MPRKSKSGSAAAAIESAKQPSKCYLSGWVAAVIYSDGGEWPLNKAGAWAALGIGRTPRKEELAHEWPTQEAAMKIARAKDCDKYPAFVRPSLYFTHIPAHAKGLEEWTGKESGARVFVRPEANPDKS